MTAKEIIMYIENWAPKETAWEKDNPGLQAGSGGSEVKNVFLCLELTERALREAIKKKCNLIFTHHPLIFQPIKKLDFQHDRTSQLLEQLIKNNITLFSAHTNLDFTKDGVSFQLAKQLKIQNIKFLEYEKSNQYKLVVYLPVESLQQVSTAIFQAGGGVIGEYKNCSFQLQGEGTFEGSTGTHPAVGQPGRFEEVAETRLEILVDKWKLNGVIAALLKVHPYEEPAYDIYPLLNNNVNHGFGALGELETPMPVGEFLHFVAGQLNCKNLRYTTGAKKEIKKIAVCGGSGAELIAAAIAQGADAFITADIKYHAFQESENRILLIDAGHYETEIPVMKEVKRRLEEHFRINKAVHRVYIYNGTTNPIHFLIN